MSQTKAQLIDPVDGTIVNADINASAAIAGTKVSPDFGSQAISTTGGLSINGATVFNESGADVDFRIEGDTLANLFYVDAGNDRIGINTSSPSHRLDISQDGVAFPSAAGSTVVRIRNSAGSSTLSIDSNAGNAGAIQFGDTDAASQGTLSYNHSSNHMQFNTGAAERARIDSSGNVGIGTTSPNQLLEVANSSGGATISISTDEQAGSTASKKYNNLDFTGYNNTVMARIQSWDESSSTGHGYLTFFTNKTGVGFTEKLRIDPDGNVGIGTTSPAKLLDVKEESNGTVEQYLRNTVINLLSKINGTTSAQFGTETSHPLAFLTGNTERMRITSTGKVNIGDTQMSQNLLNIEDGTAATIDFASHGSGGDTAYIGVKKSTGGGLTFGISNRDIIFKTGATYSNGTTFDSGTERMRIDSVGRVGIGLTPVNRILHTSSGSSQSRIQIDNTTNSNGLQIGADGNGSFQSTLSANEHLIYTNGVLRARWTANGLCFNGDTAAANALNDYEEGTWTPAFKYYNGSAWVDVAFSNTPVTTNAAYYTKIGNMVHWSYYSENFLITTGAGSFAAIEGLPFTNNGGWGAFAMSHADCFADDTENGAHESGSTRLRFFIEDGITSSTWSSSLGHLMIAGSYRTNT